MKALLACSSILLAACSGRQGAADAPDASAADDAMATSRAGGGAASMDQADPAMENSPHVGSASPTAASPATVPATSATTAASGNIGSSIPARYHGDWALKREDCDAQTDFYAVHISADRIGFFETSGDVQRVETDGRYAAIGLAETIGEGVDRYTLYLALQPDGRLRTRRGADGEAKLYVECAAS